MKNAPDIYVYHVCLALAITLLAMSTDLNSWLVYVHVSIIKNLVKQGIGDVYGPSERHLCLDFDSYITCTYG